MNSWFVVLDLQDAYFHSMIHSTEDISALNSMTIFFPYAVLLALGPHLFTKFMVVVVSHCGALECCLFPSLDDWALADPSRALLLQHSQCALQPCNELGLVVNWKKSKLGPVQQVHFIFGFCPGMYLFTYRWGTYNSGPNMLFFCKVFRGN